MVINMAAMLDKARDIHSLRSDYKLALVMGVSQNSLKSYRDAKTLPDARVIAKICELTGDDPVLILAQIEEQRATSDEARALWHQVAERLQAGAATAVFAVAFLLAGWVGFPMGEAQAKASNSDFSSYTSWNVLRSLANTRRVLSDISRAVISPLVRYLRGFFPGGYCVPRAASTSRA